MKRILSMNSFLAFFLTLLTIMVGVIYFDQQEEIRKLRYEVNVLNESIGNSSNSNIGKARSKYGKKDDKNYFNAFNKRLKKLKKDVEALRKSRVGSEHSVKSEVDTMTNIVTDFNDYMYNNSMPFLDTQIAAKGFSEDERGIIKDIHRALFEKLEDVQIRWINGDVSWEEMIDEAYTLFKDSFDELKGEIGPQGASKAFAIIVPDSNMRKQILERE